MTRTKFLTHNDGELTIRYAGANLGMTYVQAAELVDELPQSSELRSRLLGYLDADGITQNGNGAWHCDIDRGIVDYRTGVNALS